MKLEELYYAGSHGMDIKGPTTVSNHKAKQVSQLVPISLSLSLDAICLDLFPL